MAEYMENNIGKSVLKEFISLYKNLPELWDIRNELYMKRDKKAPAYEKLLTVFKELRPEASVEDVKKKINSLRTNFRKELKKIYDSKRSPTAARGRVYEPSSWLYKELSFLKDIEKPFRCHTYSQNSYQVTYNDDDPNYNSSNTGDFQTKAETSPNSDQVRRRKRLKDSSATSQGELLHLALLTKPDTDDYDLEVARIWATKLSGLTPDQRLLAEKYINEILLEAQQGTLNRNSVKINDFTVFHHRGQMDECRRSLQSNCNAKINGQSMESGEIINSVKETEESVNPENNFSFISVDQIKTEEYEDDTIEIHNESLQEGSDEPPSPPYHGVPPTNPGHVDKTREDPIDSRPDRKKLKSASLLLRCKKLVTAMERLERVLTPAVAIRRGEEDLFDVFGRGVTDQLRQLPRRQAIMAQSKVQHLLIQEFLEHEEMLNAPTPTTQNFTL